MKFELLESKRCCCCLPLRYGILIWGYFKLTVVILLFIEISNGIVYYTSLISGGYPNEDKSLTVALVISGIFLLIISIDLALTVVLLVGGHKKNTHLLKVYQYYAIGLMVFYILGFTLTATSQLVSYSHNQYIAIALFLKDIIMYGIVIVGVQGYLYLVNRSEILKLENNCQFQFVNNADRAECAMNEGCTYIQNSEPVPEAPETPEDENDTIENEQSGKIRGNYARL